MVADSNNNNNKEKKQKQQPMSSSNRRLMSGLYNNNNQIMNDVSILFQSYIVGAIYNIESSSRQQNPSLDKRTEGWTEVFGTTNNKSKDNNNYGGFNDSKYWEHEEYPDNNNNNTNISSSIMMSPTETPIVRSPSQQLPSLTLVQYRPAWFEQALLRMANIPHIVINSPYIATQSTGPLPYLQDLSSSSSNDDNGGVSSSLPVLVGRHHPPTSSNPTNRGVDNSILDYLQQSSRHQFSLNDNLNEQQQSTSHVLSCLIVSQLNPILLSLRYGNKDAWENVNRPQCLRAAAACSGGGDGERRSGRFSVGAWIQTRCERIVELKQLSGCGKILSNVDEASIIARHAYDTLETHLKRNNHDAVNKNNNDDNLLLYNNTYLLCTPKPTIVDALLFANIADALSDVHLVTILADYPLLIRYFQNIYEKFFEYKKDDEKVEWKTWNYIENHRNPFHQLPQDTMPSSAAADILGGKSDGKYKDALSLMKSLSVHKHDLQEILSITKEQRAKDNINKNHSSDTANNINNNTWYRWRMGGSFFPENDNKNKNKSSSSSSYENNKETPIQEKWRKENKHNDEIWMSGVIAGTVLAIIFSTAASGRVRS